MKETHYKQTDIGQVPEEWEVVRLGEVGTFISNNTLSHDCLTHKGTILNVHYGDVLIKFGAILNVKAEQLPYINREVVPYFRPRQTAMNGDIIIADTAEDDTVCKATELYNITDEQVVAGLHTMWLRPEQGRFAPKYLGYLINSTIWHNQVLPLVQGIKVSSVSKMGLKGTLLLCPPLPEQRRIASALGAVDALLDSLARLIEKKRDIRTATMQQLLTQKTRLKGFTEEWNNVKLGEVCEMLKGFGLSKNKISSGGKYKCILYGEIFTAYNYVVSNCISRTDCIEGTPSRVGDVIMPGSTTTSGIDLAKAVALVEDDIRLGGDVIILRNSYGLYDPYFLAVLLSEIDRQKIAEIAQGITIMHLHTSQLQYRILSLPPLPEQLAIASVLSSLDADLSALERKREKVACLKAGMMQELLTGRTRLID